MGSLEEKTICGLPRAGPRAHPGQRGDGEDRDVDARQRRGLSCVPNWQIAHSLSQGGDTAISHSPTATTGSLGA